MKRDETMGITLRQFLYYVDDTETFQVCFESGDWDDYVEFTKDSRFLKPFMDCRVVCMGPEDLCGDKGPAIRVSIDDKGMDYDE